MKLVNKKNSIFNLVLTSLILTSCGTFSPYSDTPIKYNNLFSKAQNLTKATGFQHEYDISVSDEVKQTVQKMNQQQSSSLVSDSLISGWSLFQNTGLGLGNSLGVGLLFGLLFDEDKISNDRIFGWYRSNKQPADLPPVFTKKLSSIIAKALDEVKLPYSSDKHYLNYQIKLDSGEPVVMSVFFIENKDWNCATLEDDKELVKSGAKNYKDGKNNCFVSLLVPNYKIKQKVVVPGVAREYLLSAQKVYLLPVYKDDTTPIMINYVFPKEIMETYDFSLLKQKISERLSKGLFYFVAPTQSLRDEKGITKKLMPFVYDHGKFEPFFKP